MGSLIVTWGYNVRVPNVWLVSFLEGRYKHDPCSQNMSLVSHRPAQMECTVASEMIKK